MIKIIIEGEEYTEKQYQKDLIRLFDSLREKDSEYRGDLNCDDVYCGDCPLQNICFINSDWGYMYISYDYIEAVHKWSKEHPILTNKDKMIKVFGGANYNLILNYIGQNCEEDYWSWLNKEYKEPKENKEK